MSQAVVTRRHHCLPLGSCYPCANCSPRDSGHIAQPNLAQRHHHVLDASKLCQQRLERWQAGEQQQLWSEAVAITRAAAEARRSKKGRRKEGAANRKAKWLASEGRYADALQAQAAPPLADASLETGQALQQLFPQEGPQQQQLHQQQQQQHQQATTPEPFQFEAAAVLQACKSFKRCSAGGSLCMQPQHLMELLVGTTLPGSEEALLVQLTKLVNRCAAGKLPPHCMAMLVSTPVFAWPRKMEACARSVWERPSAVWSASACAPLCSQQHQAF